MAVPTKKRLTAAICVAIGTLSGCSDLASQSQSTAWYSGGTLHNAGALEWQGAAYSDKLATCADFVTAMWQKESLKPQILERLHNVDDVRPLAEELVVFIDTATREDPDADRNRRMFVNQTVGEIAVMGFMMMKWTD